MNIYTICSAIATAGRDLDLFKTMGVLYANCGLAALDMTIKPDYYRKKLTTVYSSSLSKT
jgi:hypothetical protein